MWTVTKGQVRRSGTAAFAVGLLFLLLAGSARAADTIFWGNFEGSTISHANLTGGGGGEIPIQGTTVNAPTGIAIDSASGRIYWGDLKTDTIRFANLDGTGGGILDTTGVVVDGPNGVAIDPTTRRIYWANIGPNAIAFASLSGGGGGTLNTTGATTQSPVGPVVDPGLGKVFWINSNNTISFSSLSGGGGGDLNTTGAPVNNPEGLAIDPVAGRIYWTNTSEDTVGFASVNGGQGGEFAFKDGTISAAVGAAIDPDARKAYWANFDEDSIGFASLGGDGVHGKLDTSGATLAAPAYMSLLKAPSPAPAPAIARVAMAGTSLTCPLEWLSDVPESFLYRTPKTITYQWLRDGTPIAGATGKTVRAIKVGRYRCLGTATNFAGSNSQLGNPVEVEALLRLGKVRLNRKTGTATLAVVAAGTGKLKLSGAGVKPRSAKARPKLSLVIRPTGRAKQRLNAAGKAKVKATVSFAPEGGEPIRRSKTVVLKLSRG